MATVMVVEDEPGIREALAELLAFAGYEVRTAGNGLEALTELRRTATLPDVIVLDITMPVMDGITFRRVQLRDPTLRRIPVIVASALVPLPDVPAAAQLRKPFDLDDLLEVLASGAVARPVDLACAG